MVPVDELLALLPRDLLDRLAVRLGVNAPNQIRLSGQTVFVCLLNGLVNHPSLTQRLLADHYQKVTGQPTDHTSFGKRLAKIPPGYFDAIFTHLYRRVQPLMSPNEPPPLRVRIVDATTVVLSAKLLHFGLYYRSGGRAGPDRAKRHVKTVLELGPEGLPQLLRVCRERREADDNAALGDPMLAAAQPGEVFLFDRGCFDRHRLLGLHQRGAFFLTPHKDQRLRTLRVLWQASASTAPDPTAAQEAPAASPPPAPPPAAASGSPDIAPDETYRLLRVEWAVFENANDAASPTRQQQWATMPLVVLYGERWNARKRQWEPLVLLTNLPLSEDGQHAGPLTFAEVADLYRLRWQIEVLIKFLKQHLNYEHLTSRKENGIEVMVRMALITAVLLIWYRHRTGIRRGWRSVKFWLAEDARAWTQQLLHRDLPLPRGLSP